MIEARDVGARRPLAFVLDDETAVATMICKQLTMIGMEACQFSVLPKFLTALRVSRPTPSTEMTRQSVKHMIEHAARLPHD